MNGPASIPEQWKKVQRDADRARVDLKKHFDSRPVHDFRVAVKKMRALLQLHHQLQQELYQPTWLRRTDTLFNTLGVYRDIEMGLELVEAYEKKGERRFVDYRSFLQQQLKTARAAANRAVQSFQPREWRQISALLEQEAATGSPGLANKISEIIMAALPALKKQFRKPHQVRKTLKEMYYQLPILEGTVLYDRFYLEALHRILNELGEWQDKESLLRRTKHYRKDYLPPESSGATDLEKLEEKIREEKEKMRRSAISKTGRWIRNVMAANK